MNVRMLFAGVATVIAMATMLVSTPVQAAGERYEWPIGNKNSLIVSGGNIAKMGISGDQISLPKSQDAAENFVLENVQADVCDTYGATISVWAPPSSNQVTSVDAFCNSDRQPLYSDWSLGTVTTPTPPEVEPIDDPRVKDTSETYSFVGTDGSVIRACKGIWYQFNNSASGCVDFALQGEGADSLLTYELADSPLTGDCGGSSAGNYIFHIQLTEPRIVEEDSLPAMVYEHQHGGCNIETKGMGERTEALQIDVTNADQLESLNGAPVETDPEGSRKSLCKVTGGLSWILCPIMNTVAMINDGAFSLIENFLRIPPMMMSGENNDAYEVWKSIRNIANVLFAIVFLVVIYSQLTSAGISNYGIKKMLPKMLIGVILVNASYILVALAVDLSNVVGSATYQVMRGFGGVIDESSSIHTWQTVTSNTLAGLTATGAALTIGVMVGVSVLLPMAIGAIFMLIGLVFILTFRHAMIFILAIVAPLAFVAYMLPNTEGLFKSWFKLLRVLLYIYPAVAFIMGASVVAAGVTFSVSQNMEGVAGWVMMIIATAMPAMAIFAALMIAKTMGSVAGKLGLQNPFGGIINAAKERGAAWGRNADGAMSNTKFGGRVGGIGQNRRYSRDFRQGMRDEANKNLAQARSLGTKRGQNAFNAQGASQQVFNKAKTVAEIDELKTNKELHVDAVVQNMRLEAAQSEQAARVSSIAATGTGEAGKVAQQAREDKFVSDLANSSNERLITSANAQSIQVGSRAADAAGADAEFGATRAKAYAEQTIEKQMNENQSAERTLLGSASGSQMLKELNEIDNPSATPRSSEAYMARAGEIASRGNMGDKIELVKVLNGKMRKVKDDIRRQNPQAAGETADDYKERIDDIVLKTDAAQPILLAQKQAISEMREVPFAVSDRMRGDLQRGVAETDPDKTFNDRLITHMKTETVGKLKAEEVKQMVQVIKDGPSGALGARHADAVKVLNDTVTGLNDNPIHRGAIKSGLREEINSLTSSGYLTQTIRSD